MRIVIALAAAVLTAGPLSAAPEATGTSPAATVALKRGATLRDAKSIRLGTIDRVNADGSVQIIFDSKFVTIPADKIVTSQDGASTSLTKAEVSKLH
ncbi:hypothetical protein F9288_12370 [Sphingomonas sp. CL5.1]|uniref:hypothetical protein n=1 Tax=Sphingomonas sp. CL5.1 TaxID=2653203 RepID=UPI001582D970|nr:hypothetical protein [Sphingomonas sp. CL5.1]QKS00331.1 hypothetical protein F9288_12370 [Sphingomonas sp. CL5.1]